MGDSKWIISFSSKYRIKENACKPQTEESHIIILDQKNCLTKKGCSSRGNKSLLDQMRQKGWEPPAWKSCRGASLWLQPGRLWCGSLGLYTGQGQQRTTWTSTGPFLSISRGPQAWHWGWQSLLSHTYIDFQAFGFQNPIFTWKPCAHHIPPKAICRKD